MSYDRFFGFDQIQRKTLMRLLGNLPEGEDTRPSVDSVVVYVSASTGSDSNAGGSDSPVATLERAVQIVNSYRTRIKYLVVLDGTYDGRTVFYSLVKFDANDKYVVGLHGIDASLTTIQRLVIPADVTMLVNGVTLDGISTASGQGNTAVTFEGSGGLENVVINNGYYGIMQIRTPFESAKVVGLGGSITFTGTFNSAIFQNAPGCVLECPDEGGVIDVSAVSTLIYGFVYTVGGTVAFHPETAFVGNPVGARAYVYGPSATVVARGGDEEWLPGTLPVDNTGGGLYFSSEGLL